MAIVRKDILLAGYNGNLVSTKVHNNVGSDLVATTNGVFVVVEGLMEGEREVRKGRLASLTDVEKDVVLIHNSEVMADERKYKLEDFFIEAGKVARGYRLFDGDIITLTADLFVGTPVVGEKLVVHTDGKIGKDDASLDTAKVVFEVIEDSGFELDINQKAYAVAITRK